MTLDHLCQLLGIVLCLVILIRAEPAINRMSGHTLPLVRLSFVLLAGSALAALISIAHGNVPPVPYLLLAAGIAALLFCDRRIRFLTRPRKGFNHASR